MSHATLRDIAPSGWPHPATSPNPPQQPAGHIPALDGLRGLAILLVMSYHLTVMDRLAPFDKALGEILYWAWWGVDLFFVLSGFLITRILIDAKATGTPLRNFYARRALRIFPLYYAVVFVTFVLLPLIPHPTARNMSAVTGSPAWYWFYLSNFHMASLGQYTNPVLVVAWSLAIEEQFYLLWPIVILLIPDRHLARACLALPIIGLATRIALLLFANPNGLTLYMLTPCRLDALGIGAWIAILSRSPSTVRSLAPLARVTFVATALLLPTLLLIEIPLAGRDLAEALLFTTLALFFGASLILVLDSPPTARTTTFLQHPVLRTFGQYSYALYLLHLPVVILLRTHGFHPRQLPTLFGSQLPGQFLFYAAATALSLAAAYASWHLLEKQFLKLKSRFPMNAPVDSATNAPTASPAPRPAAVPATAITPATVPTCSVRTAVP